MDSGRLWECDRQTDIGPTLVSLTAPQMGNVKGAAIKMSHRTLSGFAERHNVGYEDAG